ncbi:MAG: Rrf2 family transcriptional regulator [Dehalococcoidia bacterium]|nr:Rrf2 family transcriptional regulator [Dehalococcoidia bacterium]HCV00034.1 Rrf2 family transcriptional regulator [Dehalococcoidia bacterium]
MRCSTRGDYGLRALIELADHYGQGPLQCSEIALRRHVPEQYLDQLLTTLRKAGFVRSQRGPAGGHELARDPAEISVLDAIVALEGSLAPVAWLEEPADRTDHPHQCGQREIWERIQESTGAILSSYTIADLHSKEPQAVAGRYQI